MLFKLRKTLLKPSFKITERNSHGGAALGRFTSDSCALVSNHPEINYHIFKYTLAKTNIKYIHKYAAGQADINNQKIIIKLGVSETLP